MEAFQFKAKVQDGNIEIPKEYLDSLKDEEFAVIILLQKKEKKPTARKLQAVKIKTIGL